MQKQCSSPFRSAPRDTVLLARHNFVIVLTFMGMLLCTTSAAQASSSENQQIELQSSLVRAQAMQLAEERLWRGLLHLEQGTSQIESLEFFLSGDPNTTAAQELAATIHAFYQPVSKDTSAHARCRFPARYRWLNSKLTFKLPAIECPNYDLYRLNGEIDSISMVFVAGHFRSPASFFGHNLLKFNTRKTRAESLLEPTINYGAIVPDGEAPLRYILLGIIGGYQAHFTQDKFFRVFQLYAERELRDLWEYPLNLSSREIELVVAHAWELTNMKLTYYFFRENCAYQIASLLNIVLEDKLVPEKLPWSLPYNVFDNLVKSERNGKPFVGDLIYHPSRKSRFEDRYRRLPQSGKKTIASYIRNPPVSAAAEAHVHPGLRPKSKQPSVAVIDTLLDYYQYRIRASNREEDRQQRRVLLRQRLSLPTALDSQGPGSKAPSAATLNSNLESATAASTRRPAPHLGQRPTMVRVSLLHNSVSDSDQTPARPEREGTDSALRLQLRPAYYDLLNLDAGRLKFSSFSLLDFKLSIWKESISLDSLMLVDALNLNPAFISDADEPRQAWYFSLGAESNTLACKRCVVGFARGGMGSSMRISAESATYAMAGLRLQGSDKNSGHVALEIRSGITGQVAPKWRSHLELGFRQFLDGSSEGQPVVRFENRFGASRAWDFRFTLDKHVATEISAGFSLYF